MRENLSAPGTVQDWLQISKQALKNLDYYNIAQDPKYARISAQYGYEDYIVVNFRNKGDQRVLIEFDVSSPRMIEQFKTASAQVVRQISKNRKNQEEEKKYGKIPAVDINKNAVSFDTIVDNETEYYTVPEYEAEEGDFVERTRYLPSDTLTLREFHKEKDKRELYSFKHYFEQYCNKLWFIWLMLFLVPPFGIFMIWYFHRMSIFSRILVSVLFFLYFILIWIGFFGIDTGFNRESLQKFYDNQRYRVTRFLNGSGTQTPRPEGIIDETYPSDSIEEYTDDEYPVYEETPVQETPETPTNQDYTPFDNLINNLFNFFMNSG